MKHLKHILNTLNKFEKIFKGDINIKFYSDGSGVITINESEELMDFNDVEELIKLFNIEIIMLDDKNVK